MSPARAIATLRRVPNFGHKLVWGMRTVGPAQTARGLLRLAAIRLAGSDRAVTPIGPDAWLSFGVPDQLSPALVVFGRLIDPEYDFLRLVAEPDWMHCDVGAAVGQYTVFAATLPSRQVVAFEPNPGLFATLTDNVALNRIGDRVVLEQVALSDRSGILPFGAPESPFVGQLGETGDSDGISVQAVTLEEWSAAHGDPQIDVLKVNVAGYEAEVLRGGRSVFARGAVGILVVLVGERMIEPCRELAAGGYRCCFFDARHAELVELGEVTMSALTSPPSPARHLIVIHERLIEDGRVRGVPLRRAPTGGQP